MTAKETTAGPHLDLMDPAHLADPYPDYLRMRQEVPVFYDPRYEFWVVTRHADIMTVIMQPETFSSGSAVTGTGEFSPPVRALLEQTIGKNQFLTQSDDPVHSRLRRVVNKAFTKTRIAHLEPRVREIADELIDGFVDDGTADLVTRFAMLLPGLVICDLLGVPRADFPRLKSWVDGWVSLLSVGVPEEEQLRCARGMVEYWEYAHARFLERQRQPREDLLTVMLPRELGGEADLTIGEATYNGMAILAAGYETTARMITNMLTMLFEHPEQRAKLSSDPALLEQTVEEALRFDTSVQGLFRTATRPVEVGGVSIPANGRLFLVFGSANHDEDRFERPQHFDITRANSRDHLSFSRGVHVCIGAALARMELRIALELLLTRLPNLRPVAGTRPEYLQHLFIRGHTSFPVEWDTSE